MQERIFGDLREGLAMTRYHLDRVSSLEAEISDLAIRNAALLFGNGQANTTIGLHSRPLIAEYQAFEFALRRSLEYLAGAISSYFKTDGNRIRTLATRIAGREPKKAAAAVAARLNAANLDQMIGSRSGTKSVRDRVAHHESVSPGVVNIGLKPDGSLWVRLIGEAEDLNADGGFADVETLSEVLTARVERAEDLALGLFEDLGLSP